MSSVSFIAPEEEGLGGVGDGVALEVQDLERLAPRQRPQLPDLRAVCVCVCVLCVCCVCVCARACVCVCVL